MKTYFKYLKGEIANKPVIFFLLKFAVTFCLLYFGTLAILGLSVPGGYYSPFVKNYLDYISLLRRSLLLSSNFLCHLLNFNSHVEGTYFLKLENGRGVRMIYKCIGYGIMSFWGAFVISNTGSFKFKMFWLIFGWLLIFLINVFRISLLLISIAESWKLPFNIDHHTLFNFLAYFIIILLMYFYDRALKKRNSAIKRSHVNEGKFIIL